MASFCEHGYEVRSSVKKTIECLYRHLMFSRGFAFAVTELTNGQDVVYGFDFDAFTELGTYM